MPPQRPEWLNPRVHKWCLMHACAPSFAQELASATATRAIDAAAGSGAGSGVCSAAAIIARRAVTCTPASHLEAKPPIAS